MEPSITINELATCPICRELFANPKALPCCMHGVCLQCVEGLFGNKSPGDTAFCPVCRREFQIPSDGVDGLEHHFIFQTFLELICHLRERCCAKHEDDLKLMLYCHDCKETSCRVCSAVEHRNHNTVDISELADSFKPRINDDDTQVQSAVCPLREQLEQTKQVATEFLSNTEEVKKAVVATVEIVKRSVDDQANEVLMKLEWVTSESSKDAESVQEAYQQAIEPMESFNTRSRDLMSKGRPIDIIRVADELHDQATELLSNTVPTMEYRLPHVTFTPADVTQVKRLNVIGKLTITTEDQQPGICHVCCIRIVSGVYVSHVCTCTFYYTFTKSLNCVT